MQVSANDGEPEPKPGRASRAIRMKGIAICSISERPKGAPFQLDIPTLPRYPSAHGKERIRNPHAGDFGAES